MRGVVQLATFINETRDRIEIVEMMQEHIILTDFGTKLAEKNKIHYYQIVTKLLTTRGYFFILTLYKKTNPSSGWVCLCYVPGL